MGRFIDLTGKKFGRLTVIKRSEDYVSPKGVHMVQWLCLCECGNKVVVSSHSLVSEHTKSCGCLQKEVASNTCTNRKKHNKYDLSREFGLGFTSKGEEFYFDLEDYDKIKDYYWRMNDRGYIVTTSKSISMHRLITNPHDGMVVDHINHNKYDNRKNNLRVYYQKENTRNSSIAKNNTSGVTGVCFVSSKNKWLAYIKVNYKFINLGYFDTFEEAVSTRKEAEEKYFGEFAMSVNERVVRGEV